MADLVRYGNAERDIDQALIALKKGTQLIKYSRKGKPKCCPFRISTDETTLIWYSHGKERNLRLASISRIIPGQRTPVFKRYPCPEKDYLSFSLLYNSGGRSLDLICKDKGEAELWFTGLKALITTGKHCRRHTKSDLTDFHNSSDFIAGGRALVPSIEATSTIPRGRVSVDSCSRGSSVSFGSSDAGSEHTNMQLRTSTGDGYRLSVSSTHSSSSQGSLSDDIESLGDVYVWGEVWSDGVSTDRSTGSNPVKIDVLTPKPLESNVVLDVHRISCGVSHASLVTRQGEVFTWGEESGGRLGHGVDKDLCRPHLVERLAQCNVDSVACGEHHTCAVSTSGDIFTWGDGSFGAGLLGHGTDVSYWLPKRISGTLEGLQVLSVACGIWHSALITSTGKLFTFGEGVFGALGHGNRESSAYPREVEILSTSKTIRVACGVWHTAAIVELPNQSGANMCPRKLFTWGDGDKHRLGHEGKENYLVPTCVSALVDYNCFQIGCGHDMTVALTTSGHVFTMGSTAYGQLGSPQADGNSPCLVQDKLVGEFVEEISCGAYHVAVLTSRNEVFTWGRGANGRLGHGDTEDRKSPTLIESLKDRHVKNISCGSNFTASICIHKWVSGVDQSVCSACRQAFGFTRKRHNCYNCGLVHCRACSSKKALGAALAPTPGKPHHVCDTCYSKLKTSEAGSLSNLNRRSVTANHSSEIRDMPERGEGKSSRILLPSSIEPIKCLEAKSVNTGEKPDSFSTIRASQIPSLLQLKDIAFPSSLIALQNAFKPSMAMQPSPQPPQANNSRSISSYSGRPGPPHSSATLFSRSMIQALKKTNEQEVMKLRNEVRDLRQRCEARDDEVQKLKKTVQATSLASEGCLSCMVAKEVIELVTQMKNMSEKLPPGIHEVEILKSTLAQAEDSLAKIESHVPGSSSYVNLDSVQCNMGIGGSLDGVDDNSSESLLKNGQSIMENCIPSSIGAMQTEVCSGSNETSTLESEGKEQMKEQFEPGVYVLVQLRGGVKIFKSVRFSKTRFDEQQAEEWWKKNKDRVYRKYSPAPAPVSAESTVEKATFTETSGVVAAQS